MTALWLRGLLTRRAGRLAAAAGGVAAAVALLASLGSFLAATKASMTRQSIHRVAVDWQVAVQPEGNPQQVLSTVRQRTGVQAALPVRFASSPGFQHTSGGSQLSTGSGKVLGLPPDYASTFPGELRYLTGAHQGALLAQQTAANLHAAVGDTVAVRRAGFPPISVRVDGIVDLPQADSLFQRVGAPPGAQPAAPPDNVLLLPAATWQHIFGQLVAAHSADVNTQIHVRVSHRGLPSDPAAAYTQVSAAAHNLEARLAGSGYVGDNLGAALAAAREDALYAQVLFLFLGVPGAVLAALLTSMIAGSGAERRRAEQALLRTRGASPARLLRLAALEAAIVGVTGAAVGLAAAAATGAAAFGSVSFGASGSTAAGWALGAAAAGLAVAVVTALLPARRTLRETTVTGARRTVVRGRRSPWWQRYGVDLLLLALSGVVFWLTSRNGYQIVLVPEGLPTLSVSYWAFAAPALFWVGAGLLSWRLTELALTRGRKLLVWAARPFAGVLAGPAAASLGRQRRLVARSVVLVALAGAFAASTATFDATYRQQAHVDALLTNGADVTVTESPGAGVTADMARQLAGVPGVTHVEPMLHRFAYVGSDLQDLYGVHPTTVSDATALQDAYFAGGTARGLMHRLAVQPDAILVSEETVKDFQLHPGDLLRLRLQNAKTHATTTVPFHYVGVVKEFPTAPRDSFFVANSRYVAQQTGSAAVGEFLINTGSTSPAAVAARVRKLTGPTAKVTDITTTNNVVGSSLTAVDLAGLTRVELAFALLLALTAAGVLLALGFAERRRTLTLARILGARPRQVGGFVWTEVGVVGVGGTVLGGFLGWGLSVMLVKVLTGVFDPPPAHLAVPWVYLGGVAVTVAVGLGLAGGWAVRAASRGSLTALRAA